MITFRCTLGSVVLCYLPQNILFTINPHHLNFSFLTNSITVTYSLYICQKPGGAFQLASAPMLSTPLCSTHQSSLPIYWTQQQPPTSTALLPYKLFPEPFFLKNYYSVELTP